MDEPRDRAEGEAKEQMGCECGDSLLGPTLVGGAIRGNADACSCADLPEATPEDRSAPEAANEREVEYSPISGWLLVAVVLATCGLLANMLTGQRKPNVDSARGPARFAVDVNLATAEELRILPRIGPALADRIVEHVRLKGPIRRLEQLHDIRGLGPRLIEELAPHLVFDQSAEATESDTVAVREIAAQATGGRQASGGREE